MCHMLGPQFVAYLRVEGFAKSRVVPEEAAWEDEVEEEKIRALIDLSVKNRFECKGICRLFVAGFHVGDLAGLR